MQPSFNEGFNDFMSATFHQFCEENFSCFFKFKNVFLINIPSYSVEKFGGKY